MYFSNDFVFICYASLDLVNFTHADASDCLRIGIYVIYLSSKSRCLYCDLSL